MKVETFKCDECGKSRDKDSNHWYMIFADQRDAKNIEIRRFDVRQEASRVWDHICGQECLHKAIDRLLIAV
jgi:hypothetical protein